MRNQHRAAPGLARALAIILLSMILLVTGYWAWTQTGPWAWLVSIQSELLGTRYDLGLTAIAAVLITLLPLAALSLILTRSPRTRGHSALSDRLRR